MNCGTPVLPYLQEILDNFKFYPWYAYASYGTYLTTEGDLCTFDYWYDYLIREEYIWMEDSHTTFQGLRETEDYESPFHLHLASERAGLIESTGESLPLTKHWDLVDITNFFQISVSLLFFTVLSWSYFVI